MPKRNEFSSDVEFLVALRDHFAGLALTRLKFDSTTPYSTQARLAYEMADAMLKERDRK